MKIYVSIVHPARFVQCAKVPQQSVKRGCVQVIRRVLPLLYIAVNEDGILRDKAVEHRFRIGLLQSDYGDGRGVNEDNGKTHQYDENENTDRHIT